MNYDIKCTVCRQWKTVKVDILEFNAWNSGISIEDAMPSLNASDRELLMSQTCSLCLTEDDLNPDTEELPQPADANKKLTETYFETQGNMCPLCGSENINANPFNSDALIAWRDVDCYNCDNTLREFFTMTEVEKL